METLKGVMDELEALGTSSIKKVLINHGAKEPFFGVRIGDTKPIVKRIKPCYELALELYDTGNTDAMYLAGLVVDDAKMTKADLNKWVKAAYWASLSESTVPWVATESDHGWELALEWIESDIETIACAGWCTLSCISSYRPDELLDTEAFRNLLNRVRNTIHQQPNRVRYSMNSFVISCAIYLQELTEYANECAKEIGEVKVMMGNTSCKVPSAPEYIQKVADMGRIGKKRKTVKC